MNAVRAALKTVNMGWNYWSWALVDATDKYNQLPSRVTGKSLHELWFNEMKPKLSDLFIFGQL